MKNLLVFLALLALLLACPVFAASTVSGGNGGAGGGVGASNAVSAIQSNGTTKVNGALSLDFRNGNDITPTVVTQSGGSARITMVLPTTTGTGQIVKATNPVLHNATSAGRFMVPSGTNTAGGVIIDNYWAIFGQTGSRMWFENTNSGIKPIIIESNGDVSFKGVVTFSNNVAMLGTNASAPNLLSNPVPVNLVGQDAAGVFFKVPSPTGGSGSGETNTSSNGSATNTTARFGLAMPKSGVDLPIKTIEFGYGLKGTNSNTNVVGAVDPAVIASQTDVVGATNSSTGSGAIVRTTSPTIVTPTVASLANMNHTHQNSAGGGTLDAAAIAAGTVATARLGSGTANSTTYLRGDQTWGTPGGSGTLTSLNTNGTAVGINLSSIGVSNGALMKVTGNSNSGVGTITVDPINTSGSGNAIVLSTNPVTSGLRDLTGITTPSVTVSNGTSDGLVTVIGTNASNLPRLTLTINPNAKATNEIRFDFFAWQPGQIMWPHSTNWLGPTQITVITNIFAPWQTTNNNTTLWALFSTNVVGEGGTNFARNVQSETNGVSGRYVTNFMRFKFASLTAPTTGTTNFWIDTANMEYQLNATNHVNFSDVTNQSLIPDGFVQYVTVEISTVGKTNRPTISFTNSFFLKGTNNYNMDSNTTVLVGMRLTKTNRVASITQ